MAALAAAGALETGYLTFAKLTAFDVACPVSGACSSVLSSPYASLFGLPLPLLGAGAYSAVALLAALGAREAGGGRELQPAARGALVGGITALATTSAYLMYVLQTALGGAPCVWCYGSAALSLALAAALAGGLTTRQLADSAAAGLGAVAATAAVLVAGGPAGAGQRVVTELPYSKPEVTQVSSDRAVALAARLRAAGAKMHGAFWCSHCFEQEQLFGRAAMADFPYVECFPDGWKAVSRFTCCCLSCFCFSMG
jgi:uncharacterized membrane protein